MHKVSDRTFLMHLGGKIEMASKHPIRNRDDLSMVYTPGVARVCLAIAANPEDARRLTIKRNSVAVVTDGSAVLGLGNIGPAAALPVMEGKAALFKRFAGIDAWPLCLDTQDTDEIVEIVQRDRPRASPASTSRTSPPRAASRSRRRLREILDIPVFHDDQHGTAIVVLAALTNALRVVGKDLADVRIVMSGRRRGRHGDPPAAARGRAPATSSSPTSTASSTATVAGLHESLHWIAENTNPAGLDRHAAATPCDGADVFIGVSAPDVLDGDDVAAMADGRDRLRAGQPGARGRPGDGPPARRRGGHRPLGLPQPDQQRAGLPRRLPRPARRLGARRSTTRCCWPRREAIAGRGHRRRAQRELHHPERVPRRRAHRGGQRRPGRPPSAPRRCPTVGHA